MSFTAGQIVDGKVTGIAKFGAFVELAPGMTGLVHISEVADVYVKDINDFLKMNDPVRVKILTIKEGKIFTRDRKSTRLNSSHVRISYAVFCLKKKKLK